MGRSKSLPNNRSEPRISVLGMKLNEMEIEKRDQRRMERGGHGLASFAADLPFHNILYELHDNIGLCKLRYSRVSGSQLANFLAYGEAQPFLCVEGKAKRQPQDPEVRVSSVMPDISNHFSESTPSQPLSKIKSKSSSLTSLVPLVL